MKTIITALATAAFGVLGAAPQAQGRSFDTTRIYISGYLSCGTPVYTERFFIGYDRCGNPIWGKRVIRQEYRPIVRQSYRAPCPRPAKSDRGYSSGHVVIQSSFYR